MKHGLRHKKIGRLKGQTVNLAYSLVRSLLDIGHIKTTLPKAKLMKPVAERVITTALKNDLSSHRKLIALFKSSAFVSALKTNMQNRCNQRPGGYLRIVKCSPRRGDNASQALVTFVDPA